MFAHEFSAYLKERNLTAYRVAKETGISQGLMNEYKSGKKMPTLRNLIKIADYIGCSTDSLIGRNFYEISEKEHAFLMAYRCSSEEVQNAVRKILKPKTEFT